jgi:hypothetical protein
MLVKITINKHMKAKLTFNLPEDQAEFDFAVQGSNMYSALWDISQELRTLWKYEELSDQEWKMVERIRDKFYEILDDHQIKLDK